MKVSMNVILILSMLWGSLSYAQPPFSFSHQEQKEYLEQLFGESVEDEAVASLLAGILWSSLSPMTNHSFLSLIKSKKNT